MKITEQTCLKTQQSLVISIFCNSQYTINRLKVLDFNASQALKAQIYQKLDQLIQQRHEILVCWVPSHCKVEKNEKADQAAKKAARGKRIQTARWTSLTHLKRQITKEKKAQLRA